MRNSILNINLILNLLPRILYLAAIKLCHLFNKSLFIAGYILNSWHECLPVSPTERSYVTLSQYINVLMRILKVVTTRRIGFSEYTYAKGATKFKLCFFQNYPEFSGSDRKAMSSFSSQAILTES